MRIRKPLIPLTILGCAVLASPPVFAAEDDPAAAKEPDVVFDNRGGTKKQEEEKKHLEETANTGDTDNPFADTAPDPAGLRAQRWEPGFGLGARVGYAFPMGSSGDGKFNDYVNGMLFVWGDLGYWPLPYLFAGLYVSGGYVLPDCGPYDSCSGWDLRAGPQVIARLMPFENVTPWVGLGFGYELLWLKYSSGSLSQKLSARGFEMVNFQAGIDVLSSGQFFGMFASYSLGKFSSGTSTVEVGGTKTESDFEDSKTHSWLSIGARGTFE